MDVSNDLLNAENPKLTDAELAEMYKEFLHANPEQAEKLKGLQEKVLPTPGCCLKTKDLSTQQKVFINVCTSSNVPSPPGVTETELKDLVIASETEDTIVDYRIPMSIGEPHAELDKQNNGCTAFDIIINPVYLEKIRASGYFFGFFTSVVIEGIYNKYDVNLDRNWVLLKRKKFVGSLREQYMRTKRLIQEMPGASTSVPTPTAEKPKLKILREPVEGHPQFLIAEIDLPRASTAKAIALDVGEDRLLMSVQPHLYKLDIFLPFKLVQEECGAQFHVSTKILTVTMPVQPV